MAQHRLALIFGQLFFIFVGASLMPDVDQLPKNQGTIKVPNFESDDAHTDGGNIPLPEVGGDSRGLKPSDATVLASTLDGNLVAIDPITGEILWTINDQPVVKSPYDATKPILPAFLPDPKDGSIYMIGGGLKDPLKKLPFTIPELVAASPCKSSDGILYTGKKIDTWFSVDKVTGSKKGSISSGGCYENSDGDVCPKMDPSTFLIGRTEYNIMMFDSRREGRKWNITFYDYSTNIGRLEVNDVYNFAHFTDSSMGVLATIDRITGNLLWKLSLGSPIVALYKFELEGLVNLPFTSVSKETLDNLMDQFSSTRMTGEIIGDTKLFPTLYVGEHEHGLFAMPSLVDKQTLTISPPAISGGGGGRGQLLIEGPQDTPALQEHDEMVKNEENENLQDLLSISIDNDLMDARKSALLLGYYQVPEYSTLKLVPSITEIQVGSKPHPPGITTLTPNPNVISFMPSFVESQGKEYLTSPRQNHSGGEQSSDIEYGFNKTIIDNGWMKIRSLNYSFVFSFDFFEFARELVPFVTHTVSSIENKELKVITVLLAMGVFMLFKIFHQNVSPGGLYGSFRMSNSSVGSNSSQQASLYDVTATAVELDNGMIKVGNITFDAGNILGKGCEGTFVYKGRFDNRDVAVKRVLAACFSIADREVDLLRESDEHPNVIRYFCMEQDRQFRYIALEYCCATLQDFVDGRYVNPSLDSITILRQATQGVQHLHNLDIVHRDIKPHNVLISMPGKRGEVRAMISDFGLCKKLKVGRMSFSRRSGIAGTEGWIAPEMMLGNRSTTCSVDVFSLGCVYYFVLTKGNHPFGESFRRQANILSGEFCLDNLPESGKLTTARSLIEKMLSSEHTQRPTTSAILKHPLFWTNDKVLNFLQDVSDRVDKESYDSAILAAVERNKQDIVRNNWYDLLDPLVAEDLRKHRSYNGKSVRDLLRALRNKRHHYHDIPIAVKFLYGDLPDRFADYWLNRFPRLLTHVWFTMHCVKNEQNFAKYFDKNYDFVQIDDDSSLPYMELVKGDQTNIRRNYLNITERNEKDNFLPHFVNGDRFKAPPQVLETCESNNSVVSTWDKLKADGDEEFQDMSSSESTGCEPFELSEVNDQMLIKQVKPEPTKINEFSLNPSNDLELEASVLTVRQNQFQRHSPKSPKKVPQLESENRENELKKLRPTTWAQAVQSKPFIEKCADVENQDAAISQSPKWILPSNTTDLFAKKKRKSKPKKT